MSTLLSIETSSSIGSIAVARADGLLVEQSWPRGKSHSEQVTACLQEVLNRAQVGVSDLNSIAVGIGPGSFTGVRVAVNLARALAYAARLPVYAVESSCLMAFEALRNGSASGSLAAICPAFRDLYYFAVYEVLHTELTTALPVQALPLAEIQSLWKTEWTLLSELEIPEISAHQAVFTSPKAGILAQYVLATKGLSTLAWNQVQPLYIRGSEAEEKLRKGELIRQPSAGRDT